MASDQAWLDGIRAAASATGNITVKVLSGMGRAQAAAAELERLVLQLRAITRPEEFDATLDEVYRRAARVTAEEALQSTIRGVSMGWRPGPDVEAPRG